jgi:hypothetical protein
VRADFGPLGVDCQALGRGGAFSAEAEGPAALYWNPAGLRTRPGFRTVFSTGLLQRPNFGSDDYGNTDRLYFGLSIAPDTKGILGMLALGAALEKPFPRFDYSGQTQVTPAGGGNPSLLAVTSSQDYMELMAGLGIRPLSGKIGDAEASLYLGFSAGLGFSSNGVQASLTPLSGPGTPEVAEESGLEQLIPYGVGLIYSMKFKGFSFGIGIRFRGVLSQSQDDVWVTFPQGNVDLTSKDLFMPPPQEGTIGLSGAFFDRLFYSLEITYLFFNGPDAINDIVPNSYPVLKFGFEYKIPLEGKATDLAVRFGLSDTIISTDAQDSVYTSGAMGIYFGWGIHLGPLTQIDAYFTLQMPGEGVVEDDTFLASVSYGVKF